MNSERKEVLFLLHLPPPVHGSSIVGEIIKESKLINDVFRGKYINLILSRKVNESGKTSMAKIIRFVKIWFSLLGKLIRNKPDLCYFALTTTGAGFRKDVLLVALLRAFRIKTIFHIHNKGITKENKKRLNHLLYRFVFNKNRVILLSKHLYYDIASYIPEQDVYYCPNGIRDYQPRIAVLSTVENRPFRILFFSNLIKEKGVFELVNACAVLQAKGYNFQCDFVGGEADISERELTDYIENLGLGEQIQYLGKRYGKLKEMVFEESDVFVLPSIYDCFPLVILEAMQHRLPVITFAEGGMPDMVDDGITGYLLQSNTDANDLAGRIEILINDPALREKMGANGRMKYEQSFTQIIFEQKLLSILQNIIQ